MYECIELVGLTYQLHQLMRPRLREPNNPAAARPSTGDPRLMAVGRMIKPDSGIVNACGTGVAVSNVVKVGAVDEDLW